MWFVDLCWSTLWLTSTRTQIIPRYCWPSHCCHCWGNISGEPHSVFYFYRQKGEWARFHYWKVLIYPSGHLVCPYNLRNTSVKIVSPTLQCIPCQQGQLKEIRAWFVVFHHVNAGLFHKINYFWACLFGQQKENIQLIDSGQNFH